MPQRVHEQPSGIATRAGPQRKRFLRHLHARLQPDAVLDLLPNPLVKFDEEVDRPHLAPVYTPQKLGQQWPCRRDLEEGTEFPLQRRFISEGILFSIRFEKEV